HVVNKTRLWNGERIDVAQELVAHFQDGLEAGHPAEQLVAQFGDVAQAAKLIRRAKRRNRPLWWKALHACCWFLGCFLVVYVLLAFYMLTEQPTLDTDYLAVINHQTDAHSQGESAWPHYREAMLALGWRDAQPPQPLHFFWHQTDIASLLDDKDKGSELRDFFAEHQPQFAELRKATVAPWLGFTISRSPLPEDAKLLGVLSPTPTSNGEPPELIGVRIGYVQVLNHAGILLAGDALLAAESDDTQRAHDDLTACLRVVQHVQESPWLVAALNSFAIERRALGAIENILRNDPELFSDEQLVALAHSVAAIEPSLDYWLEGERMLMLDTMQRIYGNSGRVTHKGALYLGHLGRVVFSSDGKTDKRADRAQRIWLGIGLPAINWFIASQEEQFAIYNELWQQELSNSSKPLWQITDHVNRLDQLSRSQWGQIKYMPLTLLMPATQVVHMALERSAGHREGTQVGIALELYRREHGKWPESLKQLSPRWLPEVPVDRINGGPLGYRTSEEAVVVYSLGTDTDDDGGRRPEGAEPYNVQSPSPITEDMSPSDVRKRDGDWVIWSTVKEDVE
ncbi:MAG: hypothetical protein GXP28_10680, partial [Planctomycetes bacterium]|nr:hypothetical protein [Planctomycetota bacterium]